MLTTKPKVKENKFVYFALFTELHFLLRPILTGEIIVSVKSNYNI